MAARRPQLTLAILSIAAVSWDHPRRVPPERVGVGLAALLVGLSEGERWGWLSAATLGAFALALAALVLWVRVELRGAGAAHRHRVMRERAVFWTNIAAVLAGFAMFGTFLLVPAFVQAGAGLPADVAALVDYGFGAGVGLVYAMLAKLIIDAVAPAVTGVAMGMSAARWARRSSGSRPRARRGPLGGVI